MSWFDENSTWDRLKDQIYSTILPWPVPELPKYKSGHVKNWSCRPYPETQSAAGYFLPHKYLPQGWMFRRDGRIWMSLTKMETESQMHHIAAARGHTVIAGLGMGFVLFNIIAKPEVEKVTLLEIDPTVIKLMDKVTNWRDWPGFGKVSIVIGDATTWQSDCPVDFLYADIWEHLGWTDALPVTRKIQDGAKATTVGYWGQEFDFVQWMADQDLPAAKASRRLYRQFCEETGLPLIERDSLIYPLLAIAAVTLQVAAKEKDLTSKMMFQQMLSKILTRIHEARQFD